MSLMELKPRGQKFPYTYHGVMGFSDILHQGMSCLRTDGAHNCSRYLFPNSSFTATAPARAVAVVHGWKYENKYEKDLKPEGYRPISRLHDFKKHFSLRSSCFIASLATRGKKPRNILDESRIFFGLFLQNKANN